ncbi:uncharacterized protein FA14DRAFT_132626 [Meira miltonrushii]|uniref:Formin GTPase-binding domain-containing protein n=1 Tax=Meira miltonrushii TaxID=1280837 RepID=A0A316VCH8_9BASI|nr:uncharacterized protein FA14DRAFT_132626 [Meira miltonrushii]PWN34828.1 hypothetical protein FA14DRAFT_132626 [Meira miltonrushii]
MSTSIAAPGSPSKSTSTLQRSNAMTTSMAYHQREKSIPGSDCGRSMFVKPPPQSPRHDRVSTPPSPGKENYPLPAENGKRALYGNAFETARSPSPSKAKPAKARARSVSPSKGMRLLGKGKSNASQEQESKPRDLRQIDHEYVEMLNEMQVPATLMHKLMTLDAKVKESMLKGQATLNLASLSAASNGKARNAIPDKFMRSKSSVNLQASADEEFERRLPFSNQSRSASGESSSSAGTTGAPFSSSGARNGIGMHNNPSSTSLVSMRSRSASFSKDSSAGIMTAPYYATMLKATDSSRLEVAKVKKMRAVLSSESPAWLGEFFEEGGYSAMLFRLRELLEMEWREEQHDDQLLHELLRCFVALTSTECGRQALSSTSPAPYADLADLLFSEKRPGELSTRKLLVELLMILPDLPIPSEELHKSVSGVSSTRVTSSLLNCMAENGKSSLHFTLLVTLLHNARDPSKEAIVDFISATHTPRPFKGWVTELLNVNRDYFWVFCHSSNRFWALQDVNIDEAQAPKVPGGMTGGVEFEAMSYLTSQVRLINLVARRLLKVENAAHDFHCLLFASGIERLLAITRKASQTYYQQLHLELARYFDLARKAGFRLPVELEAWQSVPQLLPVTSLMSSERTFKSSTEFKQPPNPPQKAPSPPLALPDLGAPLFNPHGNQQVSGGTLVGDAVKRWEQRTTKTQQKQQSQDQKYVWSPPQEWS